ncbi:MAG: patatin-like phospholipase family protein [Akkermansiaceae bacterium]|nr:patatin-like phospholipase family protein [Akkermansiaceae bacterium]
MFGAIVRFFKGDPNPERQDRPLHDGSRLKLGLALSSGGARGLAHVGVLQVLEENGIEVHAIAGSSMGAYVGSLWAAGFSGEKLGELAAEMQDRRTLWRLADPIVPPVKGLFRGLKAKAHLERSLEDLKFENLERELFVVTLDINTKERVVISKGRISDAVHASCAMPGIIAPVLLDGRLCVDGGVVDPVPVGVLKKYAHVDRILAVSVIPTFQDVEEGACKSEHEEPRSIFRRMMRGMNQHMNLMAPGNAIDTFRQSIRAAQIRIAHDSVKGADLCLRPQHFYAPWHDYSNFTRFIEAGRKVATDNLDAIRALLKEDPQTHEDENHNMVGERVA